MPTAQQKEAIRAALLGWFADAARPLPWRVEPRDPYAVWISEVMLQQTRVASVVPYFDRFMGKYPNVDSLATAPLEEMLPMWSGLGYYQRARSMHDAAREIVARHKGSLPDDPMVLRELPGIGEYTAAAIASIAYGKPTAVVDGNVRRVISRLFAVDAAPEHKETVSLQKRLAQELIPRTKPGSFNEALMELGALVCIPRQPRCDSCPLRTLCRAHMLGVQGSLPRLRPRKMAMSTRHIALVLTRGERVLLARRKEDGLFGGLWEPILVDEPLDAHALHLVDSLLGDSHRTLMSEQRGAVRHQLTHRDLRVRVARLELPRAHPRVALALLPASYNALRWVQLADVADLGVSVFARKILRAAGCV